MCIPNFKFLAHRGRELYEKQTQNIKRFAQKNTSVNSKEDIGALRNFLKARGQNFEKMVFLSPKKCIFRRLGPRLKEPNMKSRVCEVS